MAKTIEDSKKRVMLFAALMLFATGIFIWMIVPTLRYQVKQKPIVVQDKQNQVPVDNKYTEGQSCTISQSQDQNQDNDVLFIGCNGFF